jgi:hypothetical protein
MIFSLEVLQAKFGDCLILHFGEKDDRKLMVIDGGPAGVYTNHLKPRLLEWKEELSPDEQLPLSMVMVSHMDDDHVNGIVAMTNDMIDMEKDQQEPPFKLPNFWFNTFDDIINNLQIPKPASISSVASVADVNNIPGLAGVNEDIAAVIASTGQGRELRDNAKALSAKVNKGFPGKGGKPGFVRGDAGMKPIKWDGLSITVIHPNKQRLDEYQKQWDKDLKKAKAKGDDSIIVAALADADKSPFNLSSIVCLVEFAGKKMLLSGDSRSDDILQGLEENGLLDSKGKLHVDIFKLPHHGSVRNANDKVYKKITADNYVISADGKHGNPDQGLLDLLAETLKKGKLWFTNKTGEEDLKKKMAKFEKRLKDEGSAVKVNFRKDADTSFVIHLADKF